MQQSGLGFQNPKINSNDLKLQNSNGIWRNYASAIPGCSTTNRKEKKLATATTAAATK